GRVKRLHHRGFVEYVEAGEAVVLSPEMKKRVPMRFDPSLIESPEAEPPDAQFVYKNWMFHGELFRGIKSIERIGPQGIAGVVTGREPRLCLKTPQTDTWLMDPILFDCAMQLGAVWARFYSDITCLPTGFKRLNLIRPCPKGEAFVHVFLPTAVYNGEVVCDLAIYDKDRELSILVEGLTGVGSKSFNRFATAGKAIK
ncbi:MAG: polyketide synthase dehydratase domain-containing protein, partial [Candidatus Obscuribacterales bacterium]|nr:polyketide synthase dehydratase domain-containing protein [Candidatus Obscuribacterales bacterium]